MSKPSVIPPEKARELENEHERAQRERRTGTLQVRMEYFKGVVKRAAVVPDFADDVHPEREPVCFAGEGQDDAA
jgi:hypothetical protein